MLKIERHNLIDQEIRKAGFVLVPELSEKLDCSEETVRRDLKEMEKAGKLVRTHGGAYLMEKYDKGYPIELRKSYLQHTKEKLAEAAVKEIRENDVVMLDSSTTCLAIAEAILARELNITLVTNSLAICNLFSGTNSGVNLVCVGGTFRRRTMSFADPNTVEALRRYYADCAFVSCPKVSVEFGLSDNHISEANVRRQMLCNAQRKVLVVDHTKLEGNANILFDGLETIGLIITDQRLPEAFETYAAQKEIEVRICQE
ncbi:MAG: DeoR/GlpR transcriptional regulator [Oscillospiraceae bacterium]|nr:DeoR/GlpR transcriptional regulator [Oscillospiraceae bacterium]MBR7073782.1 DeoR/GlpR transcriptional regulator [Oscillospiraceae bacterium]